MEIEETVTALAEETTQEVTTKASTTEEAATDLNPDDQEEGEAEPELEDIEFGGKSYKLAKEVAAVLQKADSLDGDYTRKMQAVADTRKTVEAELADIRKEATTNHQLIKDLSQLDAIESELENYQNVNWSLEFQKNAAQAGAWQARYTQLQDAKNRVTGSVEAKKSEIAASIEARKATAISQARAGSFWSICFYPAARTCPPGSRF